MEGEGVMGINRGFLYSGAKNVIYTLFKVPDKASYQLTKYLFDGILDGKILQKSFEYNSLNKRELNPFIGLDMYWLENNLNIAA